MMYMGGKSKIAKRLVAAMRERAPRAVDFVEPFIGGAAITPHLVKAFGKGVCSDIRPELSSLYSAIARGWLPPDAVTEEQYAEARKLELSDPRYGFIAFGCSFAGKKWGGYARGAAGRNYAAETRRNLLKMQKELACCSFAARSYLESPTLNNSITYCDPPYANTTQYSNSFDSAAFWDWAQKRALHDTVFVSEYECPVRHELVLQLDRRLEMQSKRAHTRTEKLFLVLP